MSPAAPVWVFPKVLPTWSITYEVWREGQPYRQGTIRIPAETEHAARQQVEYLLREVLPRLFPQAEIRLTSSLAGEVS